MGALLWLLLGNDRVCGSTRQVNSAMCTCSLPRIASFSGEAAQEFSGFSPGPRGSRMAPAVLSSRGLCSIALLPDWTGQMPLRTTFVDDLMHFHSWHRVWGYDREASKWKKISSCKFIRKGKLLCDQCSLRYVAVSFEYESSQMLMIGHLRTCWWEEVRVRRLERQTVLHVQ